MYIGWKVYLQFLAITNYLICYRIVKNKQQFVISYLISRVLQLIIFFLNWPISRKNCQKISCKLILLSIPSMILIVLQHKCWLMTSWVGNQGKHKTFDPSLLLKNLRLLFMGFSNSKTVDSKKTRFSKPSIINIFFAKLSRIDLWVSRINWYKGHQCGSMDMVFRLSNIMPKTGKKYQKNFFPVLGLTTISVESHQLILLTQGPIPEIFAKKHWDFGSLKISAFLSRPFWIFFPLPKRTKEIQQKQK